MNKAPFEVRDPRNPICGGGCGGCWEKKRRGQRKRERGEKERERRKDRDRRAHLRVLAPAAVTLPLRLYHPVFPSFVN